MRKHLLKQLTLALLLTAAVPTLTAQVHVGDILCEGNLIYPPSTYPASGATAIGVVFYVDNTGQHGWAVALEDAEEQASWGASYSDTPLPNYTNKRQAIYDLDGYNNTLVVRQYSSTGYHAFYAVDFENGWYLPAIGQLNYLYGNLVEVNASIRMADGIVISTTEYWSSTEYNIQTAWYLGTSGGLGVNTGYSNVNGYGKSYYYHVRGVRNF